MWDVKGFNALFLYLKLYEAGSGTDLFLTAAGDCIFYFMPVAIGLTAARNSRLQTLQGSQSEWRWFIPQFKLGFRYRKADHDVVC